MTRVDLGGLALVWVVFLGIAGVSAQETEKGQSKKERLQSIVQAMVEAEVRGDLESVEDLRAKLNKVLANDPHGEIKRQAIEQNVQSVRKLALEKNERKPRTEREVVEKADKKLQVVRERVKETTQDLDEKPRGRGAIEVKPMESDNPLQELNRRIRHLNAAIEHLNAAGMPDAVEQLEERRVKLERFMEEVKKQTQPQPPVVEKPARADRDLAPVLKELRRDLDSLRKEVRELRETIKNR